METKDRTSLWLLMALCAVTLIPFLGLTDFHSKGEPREAVVALSMLKDGNWILPMNNGTDIPYKPPFLHWLIALLSLPAGHVSEFTSRLPSALAALAMLAGVYVFYRKRRNALTALAAVVLTLTSFEVHRAATVCRVDLLLTACTVGALLLLYRWWENRQQGVPWLAVLCMSGAALTKGPVGIVLPCFVAWVFMGTMGSGWGRSFLRLAVQGLMACVLPLLWYVAAYWQGGDAFLALVMEENVGRFMGKMSYESHVHPFTYNLVTLVTGWLPWTLLAVFSTAVWPWRRWAGRWKTDSLKGLGKRLEGWRERLGKADPVSVFTWMAFLLTLLFYCVPSSKRSVYLLPCYPFMGVLLAEAIGRLLQSHRGVVRAFMGTLAAVVLLLGAAFTVIRLTGIPATLFHGRHAADNLLMAEALAHGETAWWQWALLLLAVGTAVATVWTLTHRPWRNHQQRLALLMGALVVSLHLCLDGVWLPRLMNTKSNRPLVSLLDDIKGEGTVYAYLSAPMLHFFALDFYMDDTIRPFEQDRPQEGTLLIPMGDREAFVQRHKDYVFQPVWQSANRTTEARDTLCVMHFRRNDLPAGTARP